jgi:arabinan endo-1,5-alpha-L-arabinosidase
MDNKTKWSLFVIALLLISGILYVGLRDSEEKVADGNQSDATDDLISEKKPSFSNVAIHDPSIIKDEDTYYVFGTHIEAAKSTDLMNWETFTNGYQSVDNALYGNLSENLAGSFEWAGEDDADSAGGFSVWAPDIFWNADYVNEDGTKGAYTIYYSASSTYIRSAIGYAVSKNIEGPYTYKDTIMYSGFTENEAYDENSDVNKEWTNTHLTQLIEEGKVSGKSDAWFNSDGSYNNQQYPNAIDANLFYDENDKLWMVYGSWSGGIYLLEMNKETGQPIYPNEDGLTEDGRFIDRYFGTHISGGYGKSGEGPYVVYDKEREYYYLYVTYGWLGADGEYNMRVFRSENPNGPYVDADGKPAVLPNNTDNAPFGNKMMGHFLFDRKVGEEGMGSGYGYMSPGHNSVFVDPDTNEQFVVFHTRFPDTGEMFELRIHPIYFNEEDWPIFAPYRYTGEKLTKVSDDEVIGDYQYINHEKDNSNILKHSTFITLHEDHTVSGEIKGTWERYDGYRIKITANNFEYDGVVVKQWDPKSNQYVLAFTALSNKGVTIWGSKVAALSDEDVVAKVEKALNIGRLESVKDDITLPKIGVNNSKIEWKSSDESIISVNGKVNRQNEDRTIQLTAVISKGEKSINKEFEVIVKAKDESDKVIEQYRYAFDDNLYETNDQANAGSITGDRLNNSNGEITYEEGVLGKAAYFNGASGIRLPSSLIQSDSYSISIWLHPEELTQHTPTFFAAKNENSWISLVPQGAANGETMVWSGSATWYDAPIGQTIPIGEWSHIGVVVENNDIRVYLNGENAFNGKDFPKALDEISSYGLGVNYWDPPFKGMMDELHIFNRAITDNEMKELASIND